MSGWGWKLHFCIIEFVLCDIYLWPLPMTFTFKLDLGDLELWPSTSFSDNDLDLGDLDLWPHFLMVDWKHNFYVWPWPLTLTFWPWPLTSFSDGRLKAQFLCLALTLTFNPILPGVKANLYGKNQGRRSNGLAMRAQTGRQTNTHTETDRQTHGTDNITSSANAGSN